MKKFKVLSIDVWIDSFDSDSEYPSWTWNNWHTINTYNEMIEGFLDKDKALKYLFNEYGISSYEEFLKTYEIEDDQYNLVLIRIDDRKPIMAIEYGSEY